MGKDDRFVISLGGSIISPKEGIDTEFLKSLRTFLKRQISKGRRFILVCGGGYPCRQYQNAAALISNPESEELDQLGIKMTEVNAELVRLILGDLAYGKVVTDPRINLKVKPPVIVAAGWKPGCSTDKDAVLLARSFGADTVINLSNISHVYDSDPRKNPKARAISAMSWREFTDAFGCKWSPGLNSPFDPIAAGLAKRSKMKVYIADGRDLKNLGKILDNKKFEGTLIS